MASPTPGLEPANSRSRFWHPVLLKVSILHSHNSLQCRHILASESRLFDKMHLGFKLARDEKARRGHVGGPKIPKNP